MTYTTRYRLLSAQRAYTREVARRGLPALLAPYSAQMPVVPLQRRRVVRERISA